MGSEQLWAWVFSVLDRQDSINEAFGRWIEEYNFRHEHAGLDKECAAGLYVPSLRKVRLEELEFFLVHEEPRRVLKTASITYYGQYCRAPDEYIGRRVWTRLKGEVYRVGEEGNRSISAQA